VLLLLLLLLRLVVVMLMLRLLVVLVVVVLLMLLSLLLAPPAQSYPLSHTLLSSPSPSFSFFPSLLFFSSILFFLSYKLKTALICCEMLKGRRNGAERERVFCFEFQISSPLLFSSSLLFSSLLFSSLLSSLLCSPLLPPPLIFLHPRSDIQTSICVCFGSQTHRSNGRYCNCIL